MAKKLVVKKSLINGIQNAQPFDYHDVIGYSPEEEEEITSAGPTFVADPSDNLERFKDRGLARQAKRLAIQENNNAIVGSEDTLEGTDVDELNSRLRQLKKEMREIDRQLKAAGALEEEVGDPDADIKALNRAYSEGEELLDA